MKNKLLAYILKGMYKILVTRCTISIVKCYDVIDNKIKYGDIDILLTIGALCAIAPRHNVNNPSFGHLVDKFEHV